MENMYAAAQAAPANDYHIVPATPKQLAYAQQIAKVRNMQLPPQVECDRYALSRWIDSNKVARPTGPFANYPSSKQVGFAERLARIKRRDVPHECFKDRTMMSNWIDANR